MESWGAFAPLVSSRSPGGSRFEDGADGTSIEICSRPPGTGEEDVCLAHVAPPLVAGAIDAPGRLGAVFLGCQRDASAEATISTATMRLALGWLVGSDARAAAPYDRAGEDARNDADHVVIGLDCETDPSGRLALVQLGVFGARGGEDEAGRGRVLVVHMRAGAAALGVLGKFLNGRTRFNLRRLLPLCAGAELGGDVLDLLADAGVRVGAALDVTEIFGEDEARDRRRPLGLKAMVNEFLRTQWHKDREVTCSDWSAARLSLPQLKYAALDAWAGELLGRAAFVVPARSTAGKNLQRTLFSARARGPEALLQSAPVFSASRLPRKLARVLAALSKEVCTLVLTLPAAPNDPPTHPSSYPGAPTASLPGINRVLTGPTLTPHRRVPTRKQASGSSRCPTRTCAATRLRAFPASFS